jgi:hypothetical protein
MGLAKSRFSTAEKLGFLLALLALAAGGVLAVAHGYLANVVGWVMIATAVIGGILLAHHHFARTRMIPLIGMIVFSVGFLTCAAWYFWPASDEKAAQASASSATDHLRAPIHNKLTSAFEADGNSKIGLNRLEIHGNPSGIAKATDHSTITMTDTKIYSADQWNRAMEYPPPTGAYRNLANAKLKALTNEFSQSLRERAVEQKREFSAESGIYPGVFRVRRSEEYKAKYAATALALTSEILSRKRMDWKRAGSAVETGSVIVSTSIAIEADSYNNVAAYLDFIAAKLD